MIEMITKSVGTKGQIVIPKIIRDHVGINVGDKVNINVKNEKIIISKYNNKEDIFQKMSKKHNLHLSTKQMKKDLENRV